MDIYQSTIKALACDPRTYIAHLPRDILGIIRQMHPQTYSVAYIADLIQDYLCIPSEVGETDRNEMEHAIGVEPNHMPIWLHNEATAPNKLEYWSTYCSYSDDETRRMLFQLARKMHGTEFQKQLIEDLDPDYSDGE